MNKLCEESSGMVYDAALTGDSTDSEKIFLWTVCLIVSRTQFSLELVSPQ